MTLEEQLSEIKEFEIYKQKVYERLTLLDKNTPLTKTELLRCGSVPYAVDNMEFLVVKVNETYFDFIKEGKYYYKW